MNKPCQNNNHEKKSSAHKWWYVQFVCVPFSWITEQIWQRCSKNTIWQQDSYDSYISDLIQRWQSIRKKSSWKAEGCAAEGWIAVKQLDSSQE